MSVPSRDSAVGAVTIVLTLVFWASVPLFLKYFSRSIDPWTSNGWRYGFSALLWAPVPLIFVWRNRLPRGLLGAALVPAIINSLGQVCFTWAHYKIDPGLLSFGLRSHMIFVTIGAYLLFQAERSIIRSPGYLVGLVAVLGGTSAAVLLGNEPVQGAHAFGITLSILSGMMFAGYGLAVRWYMTGYNSVLSFSVISVYTAAVMIVIMLLIGDDLGAGALTNLSASQFAVLLLSAVVGIAFGHVLYYVSIARLGVAVSAGVLQLHPFLVALASFGLFRERLTGWQWVGGTIAVTGALMMLAVQRRISAASEVNAQA